MRTLLALLTLGIFISCGTTNEKKTATEIVVRGEAQGTTYTVKYIAEEYNGIKEELDSLLRSIDQSMSTYLPSSSISSLNKGDTILLDPMFTEVYQLFKEVRQKTDGAFDPTIGPLIKAWGFDYSNPQRMDSSIVEELLSHCGVEQFVKEGQKLWRKDSLARINFNAIAQGYSVDLMCEILEDKGIENYYVELGGELKVKGENKFDQLWVIGIDQPEGENLERKLATRMSLEDAAMATSGNYRKFYEVDGKKYSHTLNPKTGFPAQNSLLSATVVADNCGLADAMATAFMVMGVEKTKNYLHKDQSVRVHLIYENNEGELESFTSDGLKRYLLKD